MEIGLNRSRVKIRLGFLCKSGGIIGLLIFSVLLRLKCHTFNVLKPIVTDLIHKVSANLKVLGILKIDLSQTPDYLPNL